MLTSTSTRTGVGAAGGARRRTSLDWLVLRWQARLDAAWVDRTAPWFFVACGIVLWGVPAITRIDRLETGVDLARWVQGIHHVTDFSAPHVTLGGDNNLLAEHLPLLVMPIGLIARFVPTPQALVLVQAVTLALGVVPLWKLARRVVSLRTGASSAVVIAYLLHPATGELAVADFSPKTLALTPILAAAHFAAAGRWRPLAASCVIVALLSSDLGLVVAGLGLVLLIDGRRTEGTRLLTGGAAWTVIALVFLQLPFGETGLVATGAFDSYGATPFDVLLEMVRNPFRPLSDLLTQDNLDLLVWVAAPLVFLPLASARSLIPAAPLQVLVLISGVAVRGTEGAPRAVPIIAFAFVATVFALGSLGRRSVTRVVVDRRFLLALVLAATGFFLTASPLSPYERPWALSGGAGETRLRDAAAVVPDDVAVRVPERLAAHVAERDVVELQPPGVGDPGVLVRGVDVVVLDERIALPEGDAVDRYRLRRAVEARGFVLVHRGGDIAVFVRAGEGLVPSGEGGS